MKRFIEFITENKDDIPYSVDDWTIIDYDIKNSKILSVQRNSDGEIFKLGDEIAHRTPYTKDKTMGKIDRFWKSFEQMRIDIGNLGVVLNDYVIKIEDRNEGLKSGYPNKYLLELNNLFHDYLLNTIDIVSMAELNSDEYEDIITKIDKILVEVPGKKMKKYDLKKRFKSLMREKGTLKDWKSRNEH